MQQHREKPWVVTVIAIVLTLLVGGIATLLTQSGMADYDAMAKPSITPPDIVFPIVWGILYLLMGVSAARIYLRKDAPERTGALWIYGVQLAVNFLWNIIFFLARAYLFSFLWLILLWLLILWMIVVFRRIDRVAGYLQVPYLLWVTFAAYLNWMIWTLNR